MRGGTLDNKSCGFLVWRGALMLVFSSQIRKARSCRGFYGAICKLPAGRLWSRLLDRRKNLIQPVWRRLHAIQVREAKPSVIVETYGHKVAVTLQQKFDRGAIFLR